VIGLVSAEPRGPRLGLSGVRISEVVRGLRQHPAQNAGEEVEPTAGLGTLWQLEQREHGVLTGHEVREQLGEWTVRVRLNQPANVLVDHVNDVVGCGRHAPESPRAIGRHAQNLRGRWGDLTPSGWRKSGWIVGREQLIHRAPKGKLQGAGKGRGRSTVCTALPAGDAAEVPRGDRRRPTLLVCL